MVQLLKISSLGYKMYKYGDKVICIELDALECLTVGDTYKVVGLNTKEKLIQLQGVQVLLWVGYEKFIPLNEATKLLYTTKDSMDWS